MKSLSFDYAFGEINKFLVDYNFPFPFQGGLKNVVRIQKEFNYLLPSNLKYYIDEVITPYDFQFYTFSNNIELYGFLRMSSIQNGYSYNPISKTKIDEWPDSWFLIAEESGDPIIIDLLEKETVYKANHGEGAWRLFPIADSISQFFLCGTALHYTFLKWGMRGIKDDSNGFYLENEPASWLFSNMKTWADKYYSYWCSVFDNA